MSRSFLTPEETLAAKALLKPPAHPVSGKLDEASQFSSPEVSRWLLERLIAGWEGSADFRASAPVLVGSAARGELCPRSDIDVLFAGSEEAGARFVRSCQEQGLRLRSRFPEDPEDWTKGVGVPDLLALREGRALEKTGEALLTQQKQLIAKKARRSRGSWLRELKKERKVRESRYQSIANMLEPNLKYGPGGLRDLDQGRQVLALFPEKFKEGGAARAQAVFHYYSRLWTLIRQFLHFEEEGDILTGPSQFDLARWFGMPHKDLMREIQRGLSRVHFYSEWIMAKALEKDESLAQIEKVPLETPEGIFSALEKNPGILMQHRVRQKLTSVFPAAWVKKNPEARGAFLERLLKPGAGDEWIKAVFQSRLIDRLQPEFKKLVGHVQHDQYHRYTADVHLQQACREFQQVLRSPRKLGPLASEVRQLSPADRKILGLALFYHDLMKGREGDHSEEGRALVERDFESFGWSPVLTKEVSWLVEHHLILSQAAFRKNSMASRTWSELQEKGAVDARLRRLAVFTAVDILATNPEAWTEWKARLLMDLLKAIRSPSAQGYFRLEKELKKRNIKIQVDDLQAYLISRVPAPKLAADLEKLSKSAGANLPPEIWKLKNGDLWIRLHHHQDQVGFFSEVVQGLYSLGVSIRHAAVHTFPELGIYDWFQLSSRKSVVQLKQMVRWGLKASKELPEIRFDEVSLVSADAREWIFSFKGLDRPGSLAVAAKALAEEGLSLTSARVHTWGRQIDDVFGVRPEGDVQDALERLRLRLQK